MARLELGTVLGSQFEPAVQAGGADALFELGMLYATGRDVDVDLVTAHKWFNLSAARGNESARDYRLELAREMTTDQISEAQRQAREWLQTH
ncbi:SEL1-like repeat protein [Methyloceanibacter caenitepidi]|uniref:SEL1-like repeat protein n=1 Tax=Methyloceanibacter caenitepidi TaxID=1384459 RepID=UPI0005ED7610|nr:SEL1-like repeat protein [Methyloceanibacter caenitepidi]